LDDDENFNVDFDVLNIKNIKFDI